MKIFICSSTDVPRAKIYFDDKPYYFEFSERYGPMKLKQNSMELSKNQDFPGGFWDKFDVWHKQYLKEKTK